MRFTRLVFALFGLCFAGAASAAVVQTTFSVSGPGGITGSGWFTYDNSVVGDGSPVADCGLGSCTFDNTIDYQFTITGGIAGAGVTFTKADCSQYPSLFVAPNFKEDINFFSCDNGGGFSGDGVDPFTFELAVAGGPTVDVTFATSTEKVPTLPLAALGPLAVLLGWVGYRRLRA